MPPNERSGPPVITPEGRHKDLITDRSSVARSDDMRLLLFAAAELVDAIGGQAATAEAAFRDAYSLGFLAGWDVGRMQLDHELTEQDRRRMARMHDIATTPSYAELESIRWDGRREDFGRPRPGDFLGVQKRGAA